MRRIAASLPLHLVPARTTSALRAILLGVLVSACGGGDGGGSGPPVTQVASVAISQTAVALRVGGSFALSATPLDGSGNALTGRVIAWTSSNAGIAAVASSGIVTAVSAGTATITATAEGRSAGAQVVVAPAVGRVQVTAPGSTLDQGQSVTFTAQVFDTQDAAIPDAAIIWATSNDAIATVSAGGVVTGRTPGTVTITATSESISGTASILVRFAGGGSLTLTGVSPATLTPGSTATITGTGFSAEAPQNQVTIGGVPVPVTTATATQLTILVPAGIPCSAGSEVELRVASPAGVASRPQGVRSSVARTLGVGEVAYLSQVAQFECMELVNEGRYVVSVTNSAPVAYARETFQLRGLASTPSLVAAGATPVAPQRGVVRGPTLAAAAALRARGAGEDWRRAHREAESRIRAADRQILRALGSPRRYRAQALAARTASGPLGAPAQAGVKLTVGARDTVKVINLDVVSCNSFTRVPARVVYVGPKAVVLEAEDSPLAGQMDQDYIDIAQEFEQVMLPILETNFGNPLAYDASTDANGRVIMFFTNKVNAIPGLLGFVYSCDLFPPTLNGAAGSNLAEIFYARVPTANSGSGSSLNERNVWKWRMRATLIHEAKHIVSYAELMETPILGDWEDRWVEEGTAQIAEELYGRTFWNTTWKGNATYAETMHCGLTLNPAIFPECAHALTADWPYAIGDHFLFLYEYMAAHEALSFLDEGGQSAHIYGSAWAFLRWAIDNYATSESAFLRDLVTSYAVRGVPNVEARTGRSFGELTALFALAMATDDLLPFTATTSARYTLPSWSMASMWEGIAQDLGRNGYSDPRPYAVRNGTFGSYASGPVNVAGASAAVFELSGGGASGLIELRASAEAALPRGTQLRVAVLRVQ